MPTSTMPVSSNFTVDVMPVNDAPYIVMSLPDFNLAENSYNLIICGRREERLLSKYLINLCLKQKEFVEGRK